MAQIPHCCGCCVGHSCSSNSTPSSGNSISHRWPLKKKKKSDCSGLGHHESLGLSRSGAGFMQLWIRFNPEPWNFHIPRVRPLKKKKKKSQKLNFNKIICIKELYGVPWALPFTIRSTCQHRNPCYSKPWEGKLICGNREVHTQEADFFIFGQLYCQNFLFSSGK